MAVTYKSKYETLLSELAELRREITRRSNVVDLAGIARHMKVDRLTPQQWRQRGLLPPVDFPDIREPLWYVDTLKEEFITKSRTRRVWYDDPNSDSPSLTSTSQDEEVEAE